MSCLLALEPPATSLVAVPRQGIDNDASYQEIALDGPSVQAQTEPFGMVAITWKQSTWSEGEQTVTAKVRVPRDGQWTDWQPMQIEDDHGPDPSVTERIQRAGTEPLCGADERLRSVNGKDSVATGTYSTVGGFRTRSRGLGAGSARLGLPITEAYQVKGGSRQKFQRGWLVYDRRSRQIHLHYGRDL